MESAFVPVLAGVSQLTPRRHWASLQVCKQTLARRSSFAALKRSARPVMCASSDEDSEETVPLVSLTTEAAPTTSGAETTEEIAGGNQDDRSEKQKEIDRLRAAEKFIKINEGKFACPGCDYRYEPEKGEFLNGVKAGTAYEDLPADFCCPVCKTPGSVFAPITKTIAGFAENQQYGFGTNTMTAGQKNGLIFGSLAFFFLLLLSGYALN